RRHLAPSEGRYSERIHGLAILGPPVPSPRAPPCPDSPRYEPPVSWATTSGSPRPQPEDAAGDLPEPPCRTIGSREACASRGGRGLVFLAFSGAPGAGGLT